MPSRFAESLNSFTKAILICTVATAGSTTLPAALAAEGAHIDAPRDMNMFQVEPTVIDERYYTSGRAERHQKTSPTLPEGSPIPDNDSVPTISTKTTQTEKPVVQATAEVTTATSKIDASVQAELNALKTGEKKTIKLTLSCSVSDALFLKTLKAIKTLKVVSIDRERNSVVVEAQSSAVSEIAGLKEVTNVSKTEK